MADDVRTAHDTMGTVRLPADALWGASTQRAVDNFPVSGRGVPPEVVHALALLKWAAATANEEAGLVEPAPAGAIRQAADEVLDGDHDDQFPVDVFQTGSGTSTNMNMNEVLANRAEQILGADRDAGRVHPNDHVNASQSSNDVFPSAVHVAVAALCTGELVPALEKLQATLEDKAQEWADVVKPGRTHLMDATAVTLGQEFGGYARQAQLGVVRIRRALESIYELPLGGTAVGTGLNAPPGFAARTIGLVAERTGLPFVEAENHFEQQGARDALVELSGALKTVAVSLFKIANDVRWLTSGPRTGLHEIQLPAFQPGSSIMPGKINPVIPESVRQVAAQVVGNDAAVTVGGLAGEFELNVMIPMMARNVVESVQLLAAASRLFAGPCLRDARATDRGPHYVEQSLMAVTALAPEVGYERAADLAKQAMNQGRTLREVALEDGVDEAVIDRCLDHRRQTEGGIL
ncbi:MAG TPA: class II fumarate hydratase [Nitriliruptorales bacterium]|nr:class II fumarate hydratase [Nitriliruptorales bacterium]